MTSLALRGVSVELGGRAVLRQVDLELREGELLVLAGSNGAGKTTLLRVATGWLRPDAGSVLVRSRALADYGRAELARCVALAPQETAVPFPFRVGELVLMGRAPHLRWLGFESREDVRIAREAMARLGIGHLAERSILEVSGGERQLAVIARALAQNTPVLLLDEPTAHLDARRRLEVLEQVRALTHEGRSALVVSHDLGLAARYADRIALLAEGAILAVGPPHETIRPHLLQRAFGVEAEVLFASDGAPVIAPRGRARPAAPRPPGAEAGGLSQDCADSSQPID